MKNLTLLTALAATLIATAAHAAPTQGQMPMQEDMKMSKMMDVAKTSAFKGVEVNGGTAMLYKKDGHFFLKVSDDFKIPGSPAPHWQVVDANGAVYLLQRFTIVGDKTNRDIMLPKYIQSVAKVQVWCSFAEVNLGEATFAKPIKLMR